VQFAVSVFLQADALMQGMSRLPGVFPSSHQSAYITWLVPESATAAEQSRKDQNSFSPSLL
jgi:hypothetical protein